MGVFLKSFPLSSAYTVDLLYLLNSGFVNLAFLGPVVEPDSILKLSKELEILYIGVIR